MAQVDWVEVVSTFMAKPQKSYGVTFCHNQQLTLNPREKCQHYISRRKCGIADLVAVTLQNSTCHLILSVVSEGQLCGIQKELRTGQTLGSFHDSEIYLSPPRSKTKEGPQSYITHLRWSL